MARPAVDSVNCGGPSGDVGAVAAVKADSTMSSGGGGTNIRSVEYAMARLLTSRAARTVALLGLCAAYLQGGFQKLVDFSSAIAEAQHFGLPFASIVATATVATELVGSSLILSGYYRWVGALWLAGFTLVATFVAARFWEVPSPDRFGVENAFFEHLGLVGGFLLVAYMDLRQYFPSSERRRDEFVHAS